MVIFPSVRWNSLAGIVVSVGRIDWQPAECEQIATHVQAAAFCAYKPLVLRKISDRRMARSSVRPVVLHSTFLAACGNVREADISVVLSGPFTSEVVKQAQSVTRNRLVLNRVEYLVVDHQKWSVRATFTGGFTPLVALSAHAFSAASIAFFMRLSWLDTDIAR